MQHWDPTGHRVCQRRDLGPDLGPDLGRDLGRPVSRSWPNTSAAYLPRQSGGVFDNSQNGLRRESSACPRLCFPALGGPAAPSPRLCPASVQVHSRASDFSVEQVCSCLWISSGETLFQRSKTGGNPECTRSGPSRRLGKPGRARAKQPRPPSGARTQHFWDTLPPHLLGERERPPRRPPRGAAPAHAPGLPTTQSYAGGNHGCSSGNSIWPRSECKHMDTLPPLLFLW